MEKPDNLENLTDSDGDGIMMLWSLLPRIVIVMGLDELDDSNNDPTNDSDGDGQSNIKESECEEGDPLNPDMRCLWIHRPLQRVKPF